MNREIKFRAYNVDQKFYTYSSNSSLSTMFGYVRNGNWVIQEYSGLKDKNGSCIYEGDILKIQYGDYPEPEWKLVRVIYGSGMFVNQYDYAPIVQDAEISEVIGNICEDPNL